MTNILTLQLDPASHTHFESLRQKHFPPERNQIPAHLTLFHTLPDTPQASATLHQIAAQHKQFAMQVTGLRSLGKGVAYKLAAPQALALHAQLSTAFADDLSPQDKQRFMPHVVIQNKATPEQARQLLAQLTASFKSFQTQAIGLELWHYLGGPWQLAETIPFV